MKKIILVFAAAVLIIGLAWMHTRLGEKAVKIQAKTAEEGQQQVEAVKQTMQNLNQSSEETNEQLKNLGK